MPKFEVYCESCETEYTVSTTFAARGADQSPVKCCYCGDPLEATSIKEDDPIDKDDEWYDDTNHWEDDEE